ADIREPLHGDQKDLLGRVRRRVGGEPQPSQGAPDQLMMRLEHALEALAAQGGRHGAPRGGSVGVPFRRARRREGGSAGHGHPSYARGTSIDHGNRTSAAMPALGAQAGTRWKTWGSNSKVSRTPTAPARAAAVRRSRESGSQVRSTEPPRTHQGREALWGSRVRLPVARRRPRVPKAQGRRENAPERACSGQSSRVPASKTNSATPPSACRSPRVAQPTVRRAVGDHGDARSHSTPPLSSGPTSSRGVAAPRT